MIAMHLNEWFLALIHVSCTYIFITVLHLIIPARYVQGYVRDGPSFYRLNGLRVFFIVNLLFLFVCSYRMIDIDSLIALRTKHATCACLLGLFFTFILVLPYPSKSTSSFWIDIYLGRLKNPQWFGNQVDGKMLLYLIGTIGLQLNLILLYFEYVQQKRPMTNILLYIILFTFFTSEYLYHEYVHLYTFDFLVEYVGFKLVWGCLVFYPFFYPIAIWCRIHPSSSLSLLSIGCFVLGWSLSRGANNQKYLFRTQPKAKFLGFVEPKSINERLLCSGWWSLSRHINYLGDILMAIGLTLAVSGSIYCWLYPLYYVGLFLARERTDFERCQEKYGADWDEYCRRVPFRIIPFIY